MLRKLSLLQILGSFLLAMKYCNLAATTLTTLGLLAPDPEVCSLENQTALSVVLDFVLGKVLLWILLARLFP